MYSVKAYKVETQGDFPDFHEVEVLALDFEGIQGHAFGTNTFSLLFADGGVTMYRYQDFSKIEIKPVVVEEVNVPADAGNNVVPIH